MKIGIYDPYVDTLGGGERYCLDIAACLATQNQVDFFWHDPGIVDRVKERFNIDMGEIRVIPNTWVNKRFFAYDVVFFVSDGSIPASLARKTFLIFQFPVATKKNVWTNIKMQNITGILCYSAFVKKFLDRQFGKKVAVLPPAVDGGLFVAGKKEKLILSVGRFTRGKNTKKQEFLIDVFKDLSKRQLAGWRLVLAGGANAPDEDLVESLKKQAKGFPIEILVNISFQKLQGLYAGAMMYWHAAGYGEDLDNHPDRAEHFGITTLEAMSAGAIPVVFAGGGQKEIVTERVNGLLWKNKDEFMEKTLLVSSDSAMRTKLSRGGFLRVKDFSRDAFRNNVHRLL